jgi:hypothetical protein
LSIPSSIRSFTLALYAFLSAFVMFSPSVLFWCFAVPYDISIYLYIEEVNPFLQKNKNFFIFTPKAKNIIYKM